MMAAQARPNYESSSSKAYDALIDQLENLPSPTNEPEITFNEPAPVQTEVSHEAQIAPPTIAAPIQDNTASESAAQSHGNTFPQGLILPAQEPQVQSPPPNYNNFNGYAQPREEPKPTYVPQPVQSQPSYSLPPQTRMPPSANEKYSGYPSLDHSESGPASYPSLETSSAEDKIKNILQMYPGNPQPQPQVQQKPQPIMPQVQQVAPQPVVSQPQYSPHQSPQVQPARPFYPSQLQHQQQMQPPQAQPQINSLYAQPAPVAAQPKPVQQQPQTQQASPVVTRPQTFTQTPQPATQQAPAPQQVQQLAQAQIQSQQINQQTVQVQVQQQQQIQVMQAQQMQQQNMIQQQIQYSKEMCIQMQSYFERIARFMENVDKRLNNLEKVTNDMLKSTSHVSGNANPPSYLVSSTPTEVPIETMFDRSELERLKKLQSQFDDDAAVARRLQEEYEKEATKPTSSSKASTATSSKTTTPSTAKSTSEKYDTCPICQVQIVSSKLAQHVNECLDGPSTYSDSKTPTPTPTPGGNDEKKGFWSSLFGAKKEDTPTPTPTPQSYDLTQNPPQNSKGTYYAAPVMPTGTPGAYPTGTPGAYPTGTPGAYPPGGYPMVYPYQFPGNGQPMYYYMPGPQQPQTQPKK